MIGGKTVVYTSGTFDMLHPALYGISKFLLLLQKD